MSQLYQKIERDIKCLPQRDRELCYKFLSERDFEKLKEIVDSCLYMKRQDDSKEVHKEKWAKVDIDILERLAVNLHVYMSYIDDTEEELEEFDDY